MVVAQRQTKRVSPETPVWNSWIDTRTQEGQDYWEALQAVRDWTYENHSQLHREVLSRSDNEIEDQFWNEHNFVFKRSDGLFYHAKGATPSFTGGPKRTLIPMNMSEPIMICTPGDNEDGLGFAPHGAGRNMSRKEHKRRIIKPDETFALETKGLDVRSFSGTPDLSELPSAYKDAPKVRAAITRYNLATVVDEVIPYGCIMAGEQKWERKKK
jgi:RNA-splicing ligase RtcB